MLQQNKRGVSEMVSYVLLIVMSIAAAVLVGGYLLLSVPKDKPSCQDDVSLVAAEYHCDYFGPSASNLTIKLSNNGKFAADAAYIRIGKSGQNTKVWVNYFNQSQYFYLNQSNAHAGLFPGEVFIMNNYTINAFSVQGGVNPISSSGKYILEIQPAVIDKKTNLLAACDRAVITQDIQCCPITGC